MERVIKMGKIWTLFLILGVVVQITACGSGGAAVSNNPIPSIASISPASAAAGAAAQTLTISGTNFSSSSTVTFNGTAHTATLVNATQMTISLSASDQATLGTYPVVVTNPSPGGGASNSANFSVNNPVPSITGFSPRFRHRRSSGADADHKRHKLPLRLDRNFKRRCSYADICERDSVDHSTECG